MSDYSVREEPPLDSKWLRFSSYLLGRMEGTLHEGGVHPFKKTPDLLTLCEKLQDEDLVDESFALIISGLCGGNIKDLSEDDMKLLLRAQADIIPLRFESGYRPVGEEVIMEKLFGKKDSPYKLGKQCPFSRYSKVRSS